MLKAKLKRCKLSEWRNKGNHNLDDIYVKYGVNKWFDIVNTGHDCYYPIEFPRESNFLEEDLLIKEFK